MNYLFVMAHPDDEILGAGGMIYNLIKRGNVKTKKWIQIWEDPWYSDVYGFNGNKRIYQEEKKLLS